MIVADTNILSELMQGESRREVLAWLDDRRTRNLFVIEVTKAEVLTSNAFFSRARAARAGACRASLTGNPPLAPDAGSLGSWHRTGSRDPEGRDRTG